MTRLRSPNGCPWDKEQDTQSLLPYLIEESCEFIDAAQEKNTEHMCEELGDVLLQVVFHSEVCKEQGAFSIDDVIQGICEKMVRRHPHVFSESIAKTSDEVLIQWEKIKTAEKKDSTKNSAMDKVSKSLPTLARAHEMQRRAAKIGFDWKTPEPVFEKVKEEFNEMQAELEKSLQDPSNKDALEMEFGDILFSLVNLSRHLGIHAETSLMRSNAKFDARFRKLEILAQKQGKKLQEMTLTELDILWESVKKETNSN